MTHSGILQMRLLSRLLSTAVLAAAAAGPLFAERPPTAKLLPDSTVFLLSTSNARELESKFLNTNLGRMLQDPQLKPLIEQLRGDLGEAVAKAQDKIGLSLAELLDLYQGEITVALIAPPESKPALVMLLDAGDQIHNARKLLEIVMKGPELKAKEKREETVAGVKMTIFEGAAFMDQDMYYFEKDATLVLAMNRDVVNDLLAAWDGDNPAPLSENPHFATIMSRCRGSQDERPQIILYWDWLNYTRSFMSVMNSAQGRIFMAMMPALGLDGLSAVGGSILFDDSRFDTLIQVHVLLENPRSGIIKLIAFESGSTKPEYWVPADAVKYFTFHWDFQKTFESLTKLIDSFSGEGTVNSFLRGRLQEQTGVDLPKDVIPALEGRVTYLTWIQRPVTEGSNQSLIAFKLKDVEKIKQTLEKFEERQKNRLTKVSYAGKTYYQTQDDASQRTILQMTCFGILDDYLVFAEQSPVYEKILLTAAEGKTSLADELDFKLVMSKIKRISSGVPPAVVSFQRHDETLRFFYELAQAERAREGLKREAKRNPFFKSIDSALESNPLPPFETLRQYLAPGGAMIFDDETGIHYMNFMLKRKAE